MSQMVHFSPYSSGSQTCVRVPLGVLQGVLKKENLSKFEI